MKNLMCLLRLLLKASIFFTLFAFALNNPHEAVVHFFFGTSWRAPMVLVLLIVFVMGVAVGVMGMVPRWWRHRRLAKLAPAANTPKANAAPASTDVIHGI